MLNFGFSSNILLTDHLLADFKSITLDHISYLMAVVKCLRSRILSHV